MKTKGITIWEQHAEKIVLGAATVIAIGLVAKQFVGEPNAVSTPAGTLAPGEIDGRLQIEAEAYLTRLDERAPPEVELPDLRPAHDWLVTALQQPINPSQTLALPMIAMAPSVDGVGPSGALEFAVPAVKPPVRVLAASYADALAEGVLEEYPELERLFPDPNQPQDVKFATVFARVDLADLRSQFKGEHIDLDAEGKVAIPSSWYHDRPGNFVDIVIEREELVDDEWIDHRTLDPIPGQVTYRPMLAQEIDATQRDDVLLDLSDPSIQRAVVRPAFYPTRNEDWTIALMEEEPDEAASAVDSEIFAIKRQLTRKLFDRAQQVERLESLGGSVDRPPEPDEDDGNKPPPKPPGEKGRGGKAPPGAGGAGGFGLGGGMGRRGAAGGDAERSRKTIETLRKKIERLDQSIYGLQRELAELGGDMVEIEDVQADLFSDDATELLVWGHDLDALPGHTYRYALSVRVYNPFFGKKRSLVKDQQSLADTFTIDSEPSDWSKPTRISPFTRVWVTSATPAGQVGGNGMGAASIEVHRFYDGRQWFKVFRVQAGDYIGRVEEVRLLAESRTITIDFSTNLIVLDIIEDIEAGARGRWADVGKTAMVLLQDLTTGEVLPPHTPRTDLDDPVRRELRAKAESGGA